MSFREFMDQQSIASGEVSPTPQLQTKKWKATKPEIMQFWRNLRNDLPIQMNPIRYDHQGSTYAEDGIRITGSKEFIGSVLPRLKELLSYENPQTKLQLTYRETDSPSMGYDNKTSFVFYLQAKERGPNKAGI